MADNSTPIQQAVTKAAVARDPGMTKQMPALQPKVAPAPLKTASPQPLDPGATINKMATISKMAAQKQLGSFKRGGRVKRTGLYKLHKGERVSKARKH